jgi:peptidoglycan/xylan/chitin deacetylase (PgdA/CDA1 family)
VYSSLVLSFASFAQKPQVVALQYHHVATNTPAVTSVTPDVFREHMEYLNEHHTVIRLKDALEAIQQGNQLPQNAIAITFDDGYLNILENGHPILAEFNFPYTVFINPLSIAQRRDQLNWEQLKEMQPLADFANHTLDHLHLLQRENDETQQAWLNRVMQNILEAEDILEQRLGYSYRWLAYPFGEYNEALQAALAKEGFVGFGQQSGVISAHSDFTALPRFPSSGRYANLDTLKVKMAAISMPVARVNPSDNQRELHSKLDALTIELLPGQDDLRVDAFACFFGGERIVPNVDGNKLTIALNHQFKAGRARVNCTAPSRSQASRFYWHSVPFFTPTEKGIYLD